MAATIGWDRYVGMGWRMIGMHSFGASAPLAALQKQVRLHARGRAGRGPQQAKRARRRLQPWTCNAETANPLKALEQLGQSPWLDFIERKFLADGKLQEMIARDGLKGMTSNPSIFEKAMGHGSNYDAGFKELAAKGDVDAQAIYETPGHRGHPAGAPTCCARCTRRPTSVDGYVSLEVSPYLALRTEDTVAEARRLWKLVGRDNLMVKVPGTDQGTPAIKTLIGEGMNINVTLLFSQQAYKDVAEAFIAGLETPQVGRRRREPGRQRRQLLRQPHRRADRQEDRRAGEGRRHGCDRPEARSRQGRHRQCQDGLPALPFTDRQRPLEGPRRRAPCRSACSGPAPGTKDKAYSDVLYVEELIGRDTVNTMPPATMDAFRDHGHAKDALTGGCGGRPRNPG